MRKLLTLFIILSSLFVQAQNRKKSISLNYGVGNGTLIAFTRMSGSPSFKGKSLTNIGLSYSYELKKPNWHLETGLNYIQFMYTSTANYPPFTQKWNYANNLISIPVKLRYDAGKYIFFNGNLYLDIDVSKKTRRGLSGIGSGLGIGGQYYFNDKFGIYINPQLDLRNIATFSGTVLKLPTTSVTFGIAYRVSKP